MSRTNQLLELTQSFLALLNNSNWNSPVSRLDSLKKRILFEGIPSSPQESALIRPQIWKLLLNLQELQLMNAKVYYDLTNRKTSNMFSKIKNDSFRTLASDSTFLGKVSEEDIVRLLEAFVWRQIDVAAATEQTALETAYYVQGMNVLAAPFLYVFSTQIEAFACFTAFLEIEAPRYVRPTLDGVHAGIKLVDRCLAQLDPILHRHLLAHELTAELYAFPSLLTFSASTPPLKEVIELWDFLLAFGAGLNVLCVVAQLWVMREDLLASSSPMKLLRTFPPLKARDIIPLAVQSVADLDVGLFDLVVRHPWDDSVII